MKKSVVEPTIANLIDERRRALGIDNKGQCDEKNYDIATYTQNKGEFTKYKLALKGRLDFMEEYIFSGNYELIPDTPSLHSEEPSI